MGEEALANVRYGDPGLLIPEVFAGAGSKLPGLRRIAVVPHYTDRDYVRQTWPALQQVAVGQELVLLDVAMPPADFVDALARCTSCVSSSLHGIIAAEALGLAATWMVVGDRITGGAFKFRDYYLGTGRTPPTPTDLFDGVEAAADSRYPSPRPDTTGIRAAFDSAKSVLAGSPAVVDHRNHV